MLDVNSLICASSQLGMAYQHWREFLVHSQGCSAHTVRAYTTDILGFFKFMQEHLGAEKIDVEHLQAVTIRDMRSWLAHRKVQELENSSMARALATVRNFFRFLKRNYSVTNLVPFSIKTPKINMPLPKALSVIDAVALIEHAAASCKTWVELRNYAILMLLYGAGLRIAEALGVTLKQIHSAQHVITIMGKGNKEGEVYLLPSVMDAMVKYMASCPFNLSEGPIFKGVRGAPLNPDVFRSNLKRLSNELGLPTSTSPHSLRHSFATHLLQDDGDIRVVQELLRHESITTTQRYTKVTTNALVQSYRKFHPTLKDN
jgi:integrase/recombinase XerC